MKNLRFSAKKLSDFCIAGRGPGKQTFCLLQPAKGIVLRFVLTQERFVCVFALTMCGNKQPFSVLRILAVHIDTFQPARQSDPALAGEVGQFKHIKMLPVFQGKHFLCVRADVGRVKIVESLAGGKFVPLFVAHDNAAAAELYCIAIAANGKKSARSKGIIKGLYAVSIRNDKLFVQSVLFFYR